MGESGVRLGIEHTPAKQFFPVNSCGTRRAIAMPEDPPLMI